MKKFLALFLVIAMLFSSLALLSSCKDSVDKADVEDDPYSILLKASRNTATDFFVVDSDAREIIKDASKKGAYSIKLSNLEDFGNPFEEMTTTLYADAEGKSFVFDSSVTADGEEYTGRIYMNSDSITASISPLDRTLKIDFDSLVENFENSNLFKMLDLDNEDCEEYVEAFTDLFKELQKTFEESYADSIKTANEYINIFVSEVSEVKIDIDGEKVNCIKMPFTFNSRNVKKLINKVYDSASALEDLKEFEDSKELVLKNISEALKDTELKLDIYINKDKTSIAKIAVEAELGIMGEKAPVVVGNIFFADTRIVFNGSVEKNGSEYSLTAEISKETSDSKTKFDFFAELEMNNKSTKATMKLVEGSIVYNNESGDIKINMEIPETELELSVKCNLKVDGKKVILTIDKFTMENTDGDYSSNYKFKAQIIIDSGAKAPTPPKNAADIMELSDEEWQDLLAQIYGI